jgi:hypothetical protein
MSENKIIEQFDRLTKAKKQNVLLSKSVLFFSLAVVICVLLWALKVQSNALNKVVVIERSGEYLKTNAESSEKLFTALVKTTCSHLVHYANSFDRLSINENQAKANFYCNKDDLAPVFLMYRQENAYHEAVERGVIYKCELEDVHFIGDTHPYEVQFTSILSIFDMGRVVKFRIVSEGNLTKTNPQFPENVTGFFFSRYMQSIKLIQEE